MTTLIDFSNLIREVKNIALDYNFQQNSKAFVFYGVRSVLGINDIEVLDSITDGSQDRGIDAIYIETDEDDNGKIVHLFQFKFTENFDKVGNYFESNETYKMTSFIHEVFNRGNTKLENVNNLLADKIKDILEIVKSGEVKGIRVHFCSNIENGLVEAEKKNFENRLKEEYSMIDFSYHTINDFLSKSNRRPEVNGKLKIVDTKFFETVDGDIRGLICQVDISDLFELIKIGSSESINEDIFYENVRVYLGSKKKGINEEIKKTAQDISQNYRFFYYNNGVTITCSDLKFPRGLSTLTVEMKNFQIVNGQQTVKTLFETYKENRENIGGRVLLLVRIYETEDYEISQKIAQYTNSQNPVKLRDIRSSDKIQSKFSKAFSNYGFFYENKKDLFRDKSKDQRVDAELLGQVLFAFYNGNPGDATNKKQVIFGDEYKNIFKDAYEAQDLLIPYLLYLDIESKKEEFKLYLKEGEKLEYAFVKYASLTILYYLGFKYLYTKSNAISAVSLDEIIDKKNEIFEKYYNEAIDRIKLNIFTIREEMGDEYTHNKYFKANYFKNFNEKL